ncbi:MAG TPA: acylase [Candidatus Hydrogenedentes bacterium]|nr:acylase [Candidatus Hydrogenedentota bacterium]
MIQRYFSVMAFSAILLFGAAVFSGCEERDAVDLKSLIPRSDKYDVRIIRDKWGVPHIYGKTDADVAYGLGWAQTEDDFKHTYETLLMGRGQYARVAGRSGAPFDYLWHLFRFRDIVEAEYENQLSPEMRAVCEAYAEGFNHYAALHPEKLDTRLLPATGKDVVTGFTMRVPFFFGMDREIRRIMRAERYHEISRPEAAHAGGALSNELPVGSNTMAVAPHRTPDGKTHLAVNSHQPFEGHVAWYEARVKSDEGLDLTGGVFPGSPIILHGHNPDLGWAHTVNLPDLCDIYVLEMHPDDPDKYLFDGEYLELDKDEATLHVKLWGNLVIPVRREILRSVHGPVIRRPHGVYAIRYAGYGDIRQVEQWYRMGKSRTIEEFEAAMRIRAIPSFNVGYADKKGNIWYIYNALLPVRDARYDWRGYLPGDTSDTLWSEYLPFEKIPQVRNPASGFIQNCNSTPFFTTTGDDNPDPSAYCESLGVEGPDVMTNRALRALELYGGDESITEEEFYAYKYDWHYSKESRAAALRQKILDTIDDEDAVVQEALETLRNWDGACDPENRGTAIAILAMEPVVRAEMFGNEAPDIKELFVKRAHELKDVYGRVDVPWQQVNRLVRGEVNLGLGGGPDTLRAIYGNWNGEYLRAVAGDCYITMVTWLPDGSVRSKSIHQYGSATMNENSPHYADQAPLFANLEMRPVWLDYNELMENMKMEYRPGDLVWE